ncbi:MAG: response regulator transcription factor [Kiritimatiellae bacterium]|nr:response regulator transcription factor [Kiritimatiellia bacterium]
MNILIVEDDVKTAEFVERAFREDGFTTVVARDGEEALARVRIGDFDVAVVDIMLPKLDGLGLIRAIRKSGRNFPVIVLSALGSVENKIAGLEAGGDDYLAKPFSVAELLARVRALLRRASPVAEETQIKVDDLVLDTRSRKVSRAGTRIDLQPLEYQLLEYLMRNRGRVVSKTTIMQHVWEYDFDTGTNIVESRMCHLREKIDKPFGRPLIRTVRGFGYVLE